MFINNENMVGYLWSWCNPLIPAVALSTLLLASSYHSFRWFRHGVPRYVKEAGGALVGDSQCERLPVEVCGAGCTFQEGPEDCHEKVEQGDFPQLGV